MLRRILLGHGGLLRFAGLCELITMNPASSLYNARFEVQTFRGLISKSGRVHVASPASHKHFN